MKIKFKNGVIWIFNLEDVEEPLRGNPDKEILGAEYDYFEMDGKPKIITVEPTDEED